MIDLPVAQAHVLERMPAQPETDVALAEALDLVTTRDVVSAERVPGWDNAAVDGFALAAADLGGPAGAPGGRGSHGLEVIATIAAGDDGTGADGSLLEVRPGAAIRIMTGAPVPAGAAAVVMVERTSSTDDGHRVRIDGSVTPGDGIRRAGSDVEPGDVVVAAGTPLGVGHLGLLASVGVTEVPVRRRVRVGVVSTGDELVADGSPLRRGQVRDSNRLALMALCRRSGFDVVDLGLVPDDESLIEAAIRSGVSSCDALLSSGGVSMGDFDHVKSVLARIGDMRWMQIAIKPAKPFAFGLVDGVPVFGLPGNPVSSVVSFELLARPALRHAAGHGVPHRRRVAAVAGSDLRRRPDAKIHFVRVRVRQSADLGFVAESSGAQGSHQMTALAGADGLAVLPDGDGVLAGESVEVVLLDG